MKQWKMGRFSSGVTLVLFGIILLVARFQELSYFEEISKWWPIILILLGGELFIGAALSGKENLKISIDGKSIFITIIIIILIFAASGIQFAAKQGLNTIKTDGWFNQYKNEETVVKKFSLKDKEGLVLENKQGDIKVEKSEGSSIEIEADILIGYNNKEAVSKFEEGAIKITEESTVTVSFNDSYLKDFNQDVGVKKINYTVKLPKGVKYDISNSYGNVELSALESGGKVTQSNGQSVIKGVKGELEVINKYGTISVEKVEGNIKCSSENSEVEIKEIVGTVVCSNKYGRSNFETITGNLEFEGNNGEIIAKNVDGFGKIVNKYGSVNLLNISKGVNIEGTNGSISLESNKLIEGDITIYSKYGDVTLRIPKEQSAKFKCTTRYGSITNSLGLSSEEKNKKSTLNGEINGGKYLFLIETENGSTAIN